MDLEITLRVNGATYQLSVDTRTTLLDALRERLGLTGPKKGCDHGQCGACTVLLDGRRVTSCLALAVAHQDARIVTVEGLATHADHLHPLQQSFIDHDAFQCGYCTPGQLCSAVGMLREAEAGWPSTVSADLSAGHVTHDLCRSQPAFLFEQGFEQVDRITDRTCNDQPTQSSELVACIVEIGDSPA